MGHCYSRRDILKWMAIAAAGSVAGGCSGSSQTRLRVALLQDTIPGSIWREFGQQQNLDIAQVPLGTRQDLFERLMSPYPAEPGWLGRLLLRLFGSGETNGDSASGAGVGTVNGDSTPQELDRLELSLLGGNWLETAIAKNAIVPIPNALVGERFGMLPEVWQRAAVRQDKLWGLPWSWGGMAIIYNRNVVEQPIQEWEDLWRTDLQGTIILPDDPRAVIGLALHAIGKSFNTPLTSLSSAEGEMLQEYLDRLNAAALTYSSNYYLQSLYLKDAAVAVGWTSDLYQLPQLKPEFEVVIPQSGTALWWDLWVIPRQRNYFPPQPTQSVEDFPTNLAAFISHWFDFLLEEEVASRILSNTQGPVSLPLSLEQIPATMRDRPVFDPDLLGRGELLEPLSTEEAIAYLSLWEEIRQPAP